MKPLLNPPGDTAVRSDDRLVLMARGYDAIVPGVGADDPVVSLSGERPKDDRNACRRVLILGWSAKIPVLLHEFGSYARERFDIDIVSVVPVEHRERHLAWFGGLAEGVAVRQIVADYTSIVALRALAPEKYDNIVFLASERMSTGADADARTILGYLMLRTEFRDTTRAPRVLVELVDPENEALFHRQSGEVLVSPMIVSHMLAHVALRPELSVVFEELFTSEGAEIYFRPPEAYLTSAAKPMTFREIQRLIASHGDIALGILRANAVGDLASGLYLNPSRDSIWALSPGDELIVLTTYD